MSNYIQCKLKNGLTTTFAWLHEKVAKKGKFVTIKKTNSTYLIEETYSGIKLDETVVDERSTDYKKHRKGSDI